MENIKKSIDKMREFYFDVEKMENSPLRQEIKAREKMMEDLKEQETEAYLPKNSTFMSFDGFAAIDRTEFSRIAKQLTFWDVKHSGAVIKREGPTFVQMAVDITLDNISRVKTPGAYFRGALKNLQNSFTRECK